MGELRDVHGQSVQRTVWNGMLKADDGTDLTDVDHLAALTVTDAMVERACERFMGKGLWTETPEHNKRIYRDSISDMLIAALISESP